MAGCATDPGSTTPTTGASVTLTYDGAGLRPILNVVPSRKGRARDTVYAAVFYMENGQYSTNITEGLSLRIDSLSLTMPSSCSGATLAHNEFYTTYAIYTYFTDNCTISASETVTASVTATVSYQGNSRIINGSAVASGGGGGGGGDLTEHTIFVTSQTYNGNLGGLSGADSICATRAAAGSLTSALPGTWKAVLSDETTSAASRLNIQNIPVKNVAGEVVASAGFFWISPHTTAVSYSEDGLPSVSNPYTATTTSGGLHAGRTCNNWTDGTSGVTGRTGNDNAINNAWISQLNTTCDTVSTLYCINVDDR